MIKKNESKMSGFLVLKCVLLDFDFSVLTSVVSILPLATQRLNPSTVSSTEEVKIICPTLASASVW